MRCVKCGFTLSKRKGDGAWVAYDVLAEGKYLSTENICIPPNHQVPVEYYISQLVEVMHDN